MEVERTAKAIVNTPVENNVRIWLKHSLINLKLAKGWSNEQMAEKFRVDLSTIKRWLKNGPSSKFESTHYKILDREAKKVVDESKSVEFVAFFKAGIKKIKPMLEFFGKFVE